MNQGLDEMALQGFQLETIVIQTCYNHIQVGESNVKRGAKGDNVRLGRLGSAANESRQEHIP